MATTSLVEKDEHNFYDTLSHFPPVINGRINMVQFLEASAGLISLVERLGTLFAPVKYDMQGNIDKIRKFYNFDKNSCLLELMVAESTKGNCGHESVLWLNRALLFFELVFQETIACLKLKNFDSAMKKIFTVAYEGSVKKYHNWVTQQIFTFICKMSPTLPQMLKALDVEDGKEFEFEPKLTNYNIKLHLVRCKIDDCFKENNSLFGESK